MAQIENDGTIAFSVPLPKPGPEHTPILLSYHLLLEQAATCLPVSVQQPEGDSFFLESWQVTRAAFIARMASTLRHMRHLLPTSSRLDGSALSRTLLEHAIIYCWIAADPVERLPRFIRTDTSRQLDYHKDLAKRGHAEDDDEVMRKMRAYVRKHGQPMPGLEKCAKEADAAWQARVPDGPLKAGLPKWAALYDDVYGPFSNVDHASLVGLRTFVHSDPSFTRAKIDGSQDAELQAALRPYRFAAFAFRGALVVSALSSNRPRMADLGEASFLIEQVAAAERDGRLESVRSEQGWEIKLRA